MAGMMVRNTQATCSSVAIAVPKGSEFCMVEDYRAANRAHRASGNADAAVVRIGTGVGRGTGVSYA